MDPLLLAFIAALGVGAVWLASSRQGGGPTKASSGPNTNNQTGGVTENPHHNKGSKHGGAAIIGGNGASGASVTYVVPPVIVAPQAPTATRNKPVLLAKPDSNPAGALWDLEVALGITNDPASQAQLNRYQGNFCADDGPGRDLMQPACQNLWYKADLMCYQAGHKDQATGLDACIYTTLATGAVPPAG